MVFSSHVKLMAVDGLGQSFISAVFEELNNACLSLTLNPLLKCFMIFLLYDSLST